MKHQMNIVFGCSYNYAKYAVVMLQSLFESNTGGRCMKLFVMIEENLGEWEERIEFLVKKYNHTVRFIRLPQNRREREIKEIWPSIINTDRWLAIELLPDDVDRFLMLGVDILVKGDLWEWYSSDFENKYMIMCKDQFIVLNHDSNAEWAENLRNYQIGRLDEKFGNCEIALVSRDIRKVFSYDHMIDTIIRKQYGTVDQDYFNVYMAEYIKLIEPDEYNYLAGLGNYEEVIEKIKILHYTLEKPWVHYDETPWGKLWIECVRRTPDCREIILDYEKYLNGKLETLRRRESRYHKVLNHWMEMRYLGKACFDKYHYSAVAVYGAGELCIHLLRDLEKAGVLCSGIFDRNDRLDEIAGVKISHDLESFLREIRGAEVIVVTAVFAYDEIEGLLKEKTDIKIMSLEEIVEGME